MYRIGSEHAVVVYYLRIFIKIGYFGTGIVRAAFGVYVVLFAYDVGRTLDFYDLRDRMVMHGVGIHAVVGTLCVNVYEKVHNVVGHIVYAYNAFKRILVVGYRSSVEVIGFLGQAFVVQRIGAQRGGLVDQNDVTVGFYKLFVARIVHVIAVERQSVAFVDMHVPVSEKRVLPAVVLGLVARHKGIAVIKTNITREHLHSGGHVFVVAYKVGVVYAYFRLLFPLRLAPGGIYSQ